MHQGISDQAVDHWQDCLKYTSPLNLYADVWFVLFFAIMRISHSVLPSVLWRFWLGGRKGIRPVKNWVVGCWRGCLGWGADLHVAQQMPLPLTISCSNKSRLVFTFLVLAFWYLLTRVVRTNSKRAVKRLCVCVCVRERASHCAYTYTPWVKKKETLYSCPYLR